MCTIVALVALVALVAIVAIVAVVMKGQIQRYARVNRPHSLPLAISSIAVAIASADSLHFAFNAVQVPTRHG